MSDFTTCAKDIVDKISNSPFANWGSFSEEAAQIIQKAAIEAETLPEVIAVTWLNETTFSIRPKPNVNGEPGNVLKHDMGCLAVNVYWSRKAVEKGLIKPFDEQQVFGTLLSNDERFFDGDPYQNVLTGTRFLLAYHGEIEEKVVHYTGKDHQDYRRQSWRDWSPLFKIFFECYAST